LIHYVSRAPFSLSNLSYDPQKGSVTYTSKGEKKSFDPIEFIFLLVKHIPNKGEVLIRYYGWYSNASRGKRLPRDATGIAPQTSDESPSLKARKKSWAILIQKVYEIDPMKCPRCGSEMKIIAFIMEWKVIVKILKHLDLWPPAARAPPDKSLSTSQNVQQVIHYDDVPVYEVT